MSTTPTDEPGLIVTIGQPWNPSVDGPPPSPDELRPYLTTHQREFLEQFQRTGEHLRELLKTLDDGCPSPHDWRPSDDADTRECLQTIAMCRNLVRRADHYTEEATRRLRIDTGKVVSGRFPGQFLDMDPSFDILRRAASLRSRIGEYADWLTVAARHRGILAAGQPLDVAAERQLGYAVAPTPASTDTDTPAGGGKRPGNRPLEDSNPKVLNVYRLLHAADERFEPEGGSRKGRRNRLLHQLQTAAEHRQLREAVEDAGLVLSRKLIERAVKCIDKRSRR